MKRVVLAACIVLVSFPALAIERYNIQNMSCSAVQQAVDRDGAAILRWSSKRNPQLTLYDRFVKNSLFCDKGKFPQRAYVPTSDTASCMVRKCVNPTFDRSNN
ncbi:hypothetical protein [Hoeflea prorocentri]|uniref:KTSC domain-containing protein n=1 Tax=Hoeflea prorocentri TaxID=1922333 RepID=A0A9X3UGF7_9HYPH|nr:hypothetical protein [Hoeflea prorocentri]MCY6380257.1 hypothetical protein [Hoeflea prorocentri]MDA5398057.1 hypothetical protein [Hoeflea prorocentri]